MADKVGLSTPHSPVYSSAEKSSSAGMAGKTILDSTGKTGSAGSVGLASTGSTDNFSIPTPLFSSSFKAKMMESLAKASAGKPATFAREDSGRKCGVFGHNDDVHKPPPPPPVVETLVMDPPTLAPPVATVKGKKIVDDGFIKVVKKKKKFNGPKPKVQIPSLSVSKPGPSKPSGRVRPNVDEGPSTKAQTTHVHVSNQFSALDDTTETDDSFPELNATLKKFAKRYVETNTILDPDVFKTWSNDLQEYYYLLTKADVEEVESETDGMATLMSTGVP
ncbi:hypothetical protein L1987_47751 [Smallanthus sonchifolius]|uniref:Uncharacterized protein n=1 Tax=Smallanthus sonchifolius TaxID=185202 RepID=A0ACB9G4G5_9ASTR|nr:hypothetical protein L1987_47751 [Smallanthus sonchifolius]